MPGILGVIFGTQRQQVTREPLYIYRADLALTVGEATFDGVGVTIAQDTLDVHIGSQIHVNRVEVESCGRLDVAEYGHPYSDNFEIDSGWWGNAGKKMVYHYTPSEIEKSEDCPLYIKVFDKKVLAAWAFLAFRMPDETLSAVTTCNGEVWHFAGHTACQTKAGLIQRIAFADSISHWQAKESCGVKKIDSKTFELRLAAPYSQCRAVFESGGKFHAVDMIGFDEVLVNQ